MHEYYFSGVRAIFTTVIAVKSTDTVIRQTLLLYT